MSVCVCGVGEGRVGNGTGWGVEGKLHPAKPRLKEYKHLAGSMSLVSESCSGSFF